MFWRRKLCHRKLWSQMDNQKYLGDASLISGLELWLELPTYKYLGGFIKAYFYIVILLLIWQIWLLYESFTTQIFIQYTPLILLWTYGTVTVGVYIGVCNIIFPHMDYLKKHVLWSLEMTNPQIKKKILNEIFYMKCLFAFHNFSVVLATVLVLYHWGMDSVNVSLLSKKLVEVFPDYAALIHKMFATLISLSVLPMASAFWYPLYILYHIKFQVYMLMDYFQLVENNSMLSIKDANYQVKVKKFLTFFIKRHQAVLECLEIFRSTSGLIATFLIFSFLASLYSLFGLFSNKGGHYIEGVELFAYIFILVTGSNACKNYEDTMLDLLEQIRDLPWYNWNIELRKMYLIIYIYSSAKLEDIPLPSFVDCNYELIKKSVKFIYTVTNSYRAMHQH